LLLLVENRTGYRNLCRLLTAMKAGRPKGEGAAGYALLATHAEGLIALAGASPRDDVAELAVVFPAGHLYLEVQRHLDAVQEHRNRAVLALAAAHHLPVVATNDVRYASAQLRRVHDVLTCVRAGLTVDEIGRRLPCNAERFLNVPQKWLRCFAICRRRCTRPRDCRAMRLHPGRPGLHLPTLSRAEGETQQSFLEKMTWQGASGRYVP